MPKEGYVMQFIDVWRKDTGVKVRVPKHWMSDPKLGEPFTTTEPKADPAPAKAADAAKGK
jgi:hypothetical protein